MGTTTRIHKGRTPRRRHFIVEWAELRHKKRSDIARGIGADKGLVSRWFSGVVPGDEHLDALAGFLGADDPLDLFRDPMEDWLSRFLRGRSEQERERIKATLEAAFPPARTGTN
jgi:transcriptional regulator with XRE-family HTH domain